MPYYETVYETGRMSVACYEDDVEAQRAIGEQHRRAVNGEPGGPIGQPAERIARVYVYPQHPDRYNEAQTMSADVVKKEIESLLKKMSDENGVVSVDLLAMEVRGLSHPMNPERRSAFETFYRTPEERQLDLTFLEGSK